MLFYLRSEVVNSQKVNVTGTESMNSWNHFFDHF